MQALVGLLQPQRKPPYQQASQLSCCSGIPLSIPSSSMDPIRLAPDAFGGYAGGGIFVAVFADCLGCVTSAAIAMNDVIAEGNLVGPCACFVVAA